MVHIYRRVRARDAQDADDLEARLNAHLVTDFTLRMSDREGAHFDRQIVGKEEKTSEVSNPASAYEFRVIYRQDRSLGTITKTGNLLIALWRRDLSQWPRSYHPSEVELVISCESGLVTSIDQFLIEEPYGLIENREITEAQYSFSTNTRNVWTQRRIEQKPRSFIQDDWFIDRQNILEAYNRLIESLKETVKGTGGVTLDIKISEDLTSYSSDTSRIRAIGKITGNPEKVVDAGQQIKQEIEARELSIETEQIQFYKAGNGLYLLTSGQQPPALPRPK